MLEMLRLYAVIVSGGFVRGLLAIGVKKLVLFANGLKYYKPLWGF